MGVMLSSLQELAAQTSDAMLLQQLWQVAERFVLPECGYLPDAEGAVGESIGRLLLTLELAVRISTATSGSNAMTLHRDNLNEMLRSETWKPGIHDAAKDTVSFAGSPELKR